MTDSAVAHGGSSGMRPMVYVAGPITGDPFGCVRKALPVRRLLLDLGCVPFLPQLTVIAEMIEPLGYEEYLRYDFDVIRHCEALLRLPGVSGGADREVEFAKSIWVPVYYYEDAQSWNAFCRDMATQPPSIGSPPPDELRSLQSAVWRIVNEVEDVNVITEGGDIIRLLDFEADAVRRALAANEPGGSNGSS